MTFLTHEGFPGMTWGDWGLVGWSITSVGALAAFRMDCGLLGDWVPSTSSSSLARTAPEAFEVLLVFLAKIGSFFHEDSNLSWSVSKGGVFTNIAAVG